MEDSPTMFLINSFEKNWILLLPPTSHKYNSTERTNEWVTSQLIIGKKKFDKGLKKVFHGF